MIRNRVLPAALALALTVSPSARGAETRLRVIDTAPNDVLNVRRFPDIGAPIVGIIPPDGRGIVHEGETYANWIFVRYKSTEGWVSRRFVAPDRGAATGSR
ncbi:MAG TPA: SH3 domain-containing protein [Methylobacterium sp.]